MLYVQIIKKNINIPGWIILKLYAEISKKIIKNFRQIFFTQQAKIIKKMNNN